MTKPFETQFKIRYYDCDPFGLLSHAGYLRLTVQAAHEASEAIGQDLINGEARWQLREAGINYLRPAEIGETLTVRTKVTDWRDKSLSLEHDFLIDSVAMAKVCCDWEIVSLETLEPIRIPDSLLHAFFQASIPPEAPPRDSFPEFPEVPDGAFAAHRQIRWGLLNPDGWLDYANFIAISEEVDMDASAYQGWTPQRLDEAGFSISVEDFHIEFLAPVLWGADLGITTYLSDVEDTSVTRYYEFELPNLGPVARAYTKRVWRATDTGEPTEIPDDWWSDMAGQIASDVY